MFFLHLCLVSSQIKLCIYPISEEQLCPDGYSPTPVESTFNFPTETQNVELEIYVSQTAKKAINFQQFICFRNCSITFIGYNGSQRIIFDSDISESNLSLIDINLVRLRCSPVTLYNLNVSGSDISIYCPKFYVSNKFISKNSDIDISKILADHQCTDSFVIDNRDIDTIAILDYGDCNINHKHAVLKKLFKSIDIIVSGDYLNIEYIKQRDVERFEPPINIIVNTDCFLTFNGWRDFNQKISNKIEIRSNHELYIQNDQIPTQIFHITKYKEVQINQNGRYCIIPSIKFLPEIHYYNCDILFQTSQNTPSNFYFYQKYEKDLIFILFNTQREKPFVFNEFNISYNYHFISSKTLNSSVPHVSNKVETQLTNRSLYPTTSDFGVDDKDFMIIQTDLQGLNISLDSIEVYFEMTSITKLRDLSLANNSYMKIKSRIISITNKLTLINTNKEDILNIKNTINTNDLFIYPILNDDIDLTATYNNTIYNTLSYFIRNNITLLMSKPNAKNINLPLIEIINESTIHLDSSLFKGNGPNLLNNSLFINIKPYTKVTFISFRNIDLYAYKFLPKPNDYISYQIKNDEETQLPYSFTFSIIDISVLSIVLLVACAIIFILFYKIRSKSKKSKDIQELLVISNDDVDVYDITNDPISF